MNQLLSVPGRKYAKAKTSPSVSYQGKDNEDLKKEINGQFLLAKRYLDPIHDRMNQQEELYRSFIDKNTYPHNARVFDPRVFRIVETITPRMVSNEPTGSFYPTESADVATAQIFNALIKYDWRRAGMFPKLVLFVKCLLIFGTAFGRTYWDYQETQKKRMVVENVNGKPMWTPKNTEMVNVTEFDGPNFEVLNIYDCFPDPNATSLGNMRWFIYRSFKTLDELKKENELRGNDYYINLDVLEEKMKANQTQTGDNAQTPGAQPANVTISQTNLQYREHRRVMLSTQELVGQDASNPDIVILRRFTKSGWCDYVPEYDLIIREIDNPYFHGELPLIYGVDYPYPGELYGMGEIEPLDRIQRAINAVLNQRLDNVQLTLRTMWKVRKGGGVDMHTLVSAPGNIVTTDDMNAVDTIQVPDVTGPTFVQTMNYLTAAMQNGSGITDYTQGIQTNQNITNNTATGIQAIQQEANAQFKLKIQLFNHMVIQRIANQWKDLRIQYTTEEQKLRIIGKEDVQYLKQNTNLQTMDTMGNPIAPGDMTTPTKLTVSPDSSFAFLNLMPGDIQPSIVGDYDFIAQANSEQLSDPMVLQQNFFSALDRVSNPAWIQGMASMGKSINYPALTQKIFDKLQLGLEDKDVVVDMKPPAPPQPPSLGGQPQPDLSQMAMPMGGTMPPMTGTSPMGPGMGGGLNG